VVIAITCPQIQEHCVDPVLKSDNFIQPVAASLGLPSLREHIHVRVSRCGRRGRWLRRGHVAGVCIAGGLHHLVGQGTEAGGGVDGDEGQAPG
jgi:hypothetical protein